MTTTTTDMTRAAIIYYSATGHVHALAEAAADGAAKAGAQVRLRRAPEVASAEAVAARPDWQQHANGSAEVGTAQVGDLEWADVVLFGTPTRYGMVASQLQHLIDGTESSWRTGALQDKVYGAFVATATDHGGQESTLLSLYTVFAHWGGVIVPPGFTDPVQFALGNPYGASAAGRGRPSDISLAAARYQARRAVETAAALKVGRRP